MPRMLALPIALAAVLATAACASAGDQAGSAPTATDASSTPSQSAPSTASAEPGGAAESGAAPESEAPEPSGTAPSGSGSPHTFGATDPAMRRDPGQPGLPAASGASVDDVLRLGAVVSWLDQPSRIALSLPATSTCGPLAGEPVLESPTRIVVDFDPPAQPCGPPDGARTYEVQVPSGVDARADLEVAVVGLELEFTLTLPRR